MGGLGAMLGVGIEAVFNFPFGVIYPIPIALFVLFALIGYKPAR